MVFSSSIFLLLFLPAVYLLNLLVTKLFKNSTAASNVFLLLASLVFYAWGEPVLVLLMIGSILLNWFCGLMIAKTRRAQAPVAPAPMGTDPIGAKLWLILAVLGDLAALGYYKYAGFLVKTLNGLLGREVLTPLEIALPIGISFFTFQAVSYVVDVYRGTTEASKNPINTALYISFFPQLIAGPIVKYRDVNRQIESRTITPARLADGFRRFIYGLGKKVMIANVLGLCVDKIYSYNIGVIDPLAAWIAALAYAFQIYYDFSGYSDMAIGLGKMFGFDYLENFNYPYLSKSVGEFWRRWHISLGTWFREYVYIPLGGNRKGKLRTYLNLAVVFLLTGLWHGADVSFILWGAWHGFWVILERLCLRKFLNKHKIIKSHRKAQGTVQIKKIISFHCCHSAEYFDIVRFRIIHLQSLRHLHTGLAGVDGVNAIALDPFDLFLRDIAKQNIGLCGPDHRFLILIQKLDTLYSTVRSLVKLSGKRFNAEHVTVLRDFNCLSVENIHGRLRKNSPARSFKNFIGDILHIVSDQFPNSGQSFHSQETGNLFLELSGCYRIGLLLLHIDPSDFTHRSRSLLLWGDILYFVSWNYNIRIPNVHTWVIQ